MATKEYPDTPRTQSFEYPQQFMAEQKELLILLSNRASNYFKTVMTVTYDIFICLKINGAVSERQDSLSDVFAIFLKVLILRSILQTASTRTALFAMLHFREL